METDKIQNSPKRFFNWKKITLYTISVGLICCIVLLTITLHWISSDVRAHCKKAQ